MLRSRIERAGAPVQEGGRRRRSKSLTAIAAGTTASLLLGAGLALSGGTAANAAVTNSTGAPATSGGIKVAYFDQWSIYANAYYPKTIQDTGVAGKLDYLVYSFANIHPTNLSCFQATKAANQDDNNPNAGDGAGDAFADYQKSFGPDISVDGVGDAWGQPIAGNFNQLKKLKAKNPNLKILISLGGWTYSKYFSAAAATDASRKKLVSSCIDMFIKETCRSTPATAARPRRPASSTASTSTGSTRAAAATPATWRARTTSRTSPCC